MIAILIALSVVVALIVIVACVFGAREEEQTPEPPPRWIPVTEHHSSVILKIERAPLDRAA